MFTSRRDTIKLMAAAAGLTTAAPYISATASRATAAEPSQMKTPYQMKKLVHGVCYYPELWPEEDIDRDIAEMKQLGINMIRVGEFSWSRLEPEEGKISIHFWRDVIDKFH